MVTCGYTFTCESGVVYVHKESFGEHKLVVLRGVLKPYGDLTLDIYYGQSKRRITLIKSLRKEPERLEQYCDTNAVAQKLRGWGVEITTGYDFGFVDPTLEHHASDTCTFSFRFS